MRRYRIDAAQEMKYLKMPKGGELSTEATECEMEFHAELVALREVVSIARELVRLDGHAMNCGFRGCTCGATQDYKVARSEFLRRLRVLKLADGTEAAE